MNNDNASKDVSNLPQITLPDQMLGSVKDVSNYDPSRIQHYEIINGAVHLYMNELD